MPTLTRFVRTIAVAAGLAYAVLWSLATLVEPRTRPMSEPVESRILREAGRDATGALPARGAPRREPNG